MKLLDVFICSHDTGSLPCFHVGPSGTPPQPSPHCCLQGILQASETHGQIPHLPISGLIFHSSPAGALHSPGCHSSDGTCVQTPSHGMSTPICFRPFKFLSREGLSFPAPSLTPLTSTALTRSLPKKVLTPKRIGDPLALVNEHLSLSVASIGWNMKACFQKDFQWLFFRLFPPFCCFQNKCFHKDSKGVC